MADTGMDSAGSGGRAGAHRTAAGKPRLPAEFIYDGGQIIIELLSARAEEEEKRRFVERLRRLDSRAGARNLP